MAKDDKVILACSVCLSRNYTTSHKKNSAKRLELMKYCPKCNQKTLHKETKQETLYVIKNVTICE